VLTKTYCLSHTSSPFCSGYFGDGVLRTTCPGWHRTTILSISAFQVARITGVNHQSPAALLLLRYGLDLCPDGPGHSFFFACFVCFCSVE
jgi:hypothetical protein